MKRLVLAVTMILVTLAFPVYASEDNDTDTGYYVGVKAGTWRYSGDTQGTLNDSSVGFFGGYKLNRNLAVEFDYLYNQEAFANNALESNSTESDSYILTLRPILPLNDHWELFAKFGWEYYEVDQTITEENGASNNNDATENAFSQGLGVAWNGDGYSIRAEFQTDESFDFQVYSVGVSYTF